MESTVNETTCMMPAAMHYIENTASQSAYVEVPNGYFYRQCFNASQGQEQEVDNLFPPATTSYYFS